MNLGAPTVDDRAERDLLLIDFFTEEIHAGVDTDGIVQHRSAVLKIFDFFLDLERSPTR